MTLASRPFAPYLLRVTPFSTRALAVVRAIAKGQVATYGQVATWAGAPRGARAVARALASLAPGAEDSVPWHRVVRGDGRLGLSGSAGVEQRRRLRAEGVRFTPDGRVILAHFGWAGPSAAGSRGRAP